MLILLFVHLRGSGITEMTKSHLDQESCVPIQSISPRPCQSWTMATFPFPSLLPCCPHDTLVLLCQHRRSSTPAWELNCLSIYSFVAALCIGECCTLASANGKGMGLFLSQLSIHAPLTGNTTSASGFQALGASSENAMSLQRLWGLLHHPCFLVWVTLREQDGGEGGSPQRKFTELGPALPPVQVSQGWRDARALPSGELYRVVKERDKNTTEEGVGRKRQASCSKHCLAWSVPDANLWSLYHIFVRIRISASKAAGTIANMWEMPRVLRDSQSPACGPSMWAEELFGDEGSTECHLER